MNEFNFYNFEFSSKCTTSGQGLNPFPKPRLHNRSVYGLASRDGTTLGLRVATPLPAFEKNFPSIYTTIKKKNFGSKMNILGPPLSKYLQADPWNQKKKKIIKSSVVWLSQEYQEKHLAKHLNNFQIWMIRKIYKTIHIFR